jgi:imidazoleglycerol-phosphate dehydratase
MPTFKVGDFDTELSEEFFEAFVREARITLHIKKLDGKNSHHIIEGIFKAVARALSKATALDEAHKDEMPSTKGVL